MLGQRGTRAKAQVRKREQQGIERSSWVPGDQLGINPEESVKLTVDPMACVPPAVAHPVADSDSAPISSTHAETVGSCQLYVLASM